VDELRDARAVLVTTPARWASLADTVAADLLARSPAPGEWSALECLQHLVDNEELVVLPRLEALLAGQDFDPTHPRSRWTPPDSAAQAGRLARELATRFAGLRSEVLQIVDGLVVEDLSRTARHPRHGPVTLALMLRYLAGHDLMHTVQAERAVMQPFIEGSGPWRPAFADHDAALTRAGATDGNPDRHRSGKA
jgi:hypothetical protein